MLYIILPISILLIALIVIGLYFLLKPKKTPSTSKPPSAPKGLKRGNLVLLQGKINSHSLKKFNPAVFLFPGNHIYHHKNGQVTLKSTEGGGLAKAATSLCHSNESVLSVATQLGHTAENFDNQLKDNPVARGAFARSLMACWYLLGKGKTLVIPVRNRLKKALFQAPIESTDDLEPSWWGGNNNNVAPLAAELLLQHINSLIAGKPSEAYVSQLNNTFNSTDMTLTPQEALDLGKKDASDHSFSLPDCIATATS